MHYILIVSPISLLEIDVKLSRKGLKSDSKTRHKDAINPVKLETLDMDLLSQNYFKTLRYNFDNLSQLRVHWHFEKKDHQNFLDYCYIR